MLLVEGADKVTHIRAENALHRPLIRRHDVNLQVPRAQRGSDLEPDKACPDDNDPLCRLGALNDGLAIGERA